MMDTTDRRILRVLQQDARITMTALAEQISMSTPATAERVHRLEEQQIIRGYHADISAAAAGYEIEVMMLVTAHAGAEQELYQLIEERQEVVAAWDLAGRTGLLLRVICRDMASFQALVEAFQQVSTTESYFCLHQRKGTQFPVEDT